MATNLGTAYVQIMPSAKGIKGSIQNVLDPEAKSSGKSAGDGMAGSLISVAKKFLIAAGIGKIISSSITEGGKLQQPLGGIETLFKGSADKLKKYASESFRTVGVSANEYMENVTSFSASLLQSLGGDTAKAADVANMAMIDMADNSNKMGTSMQDIQNAYQGFAKQNYTMLDNLKLGYGGTKSEMQRLLADATKLTGVKYDINNLSDVYNAIHAVQGKLEITGTTAKEAQTTFTGSFNAMKSAAQDFLGKLAIGADITGPLKNMVTTASTFLFQNLIPMVWNIIKEIPQAVVTLLTTAGPILIEQGNALIQWLISGLTTGLPMLLEQFSTMFGQLMQRITEQGPQLIQKGMDILTQIGMGIITALPQIAETLSQVFSEYFQGESVLTSQLLESGVQMGLNLANGIFQAAPGVLTSIGDILASALEFLLSNIPMFIEKGIEFIAGLASGLLNNLPAVITAMSGIIQKLIGVIINNLPNIVNKGFELIGKLASGLLNNLPSIIGSIGKILAALIKAIIDILPKLLSLGVKLIANLASGLLQSLGSVIGNAGQIVSALVNKFTGAIGQMVSAGANLIRGLWRGIGSAKDWILGKIGGFVNGIVGGIKSFFGIHSPSRVFAEIGKYLDLGLAVGIEDNMKPVTRAVEALGEEATGAFEPDLAFALDTSMNPLSSGLTPALSGASAGGNYNVTMYNTISSDYDVDKAIRKLDEGLAGLASEKERGRGVR